MGAERPNPAPRAGGHRVLDLVNAVVHDDPDHTPIHQASQTTTPCAVLPPGVPAGSIIAKHWYGLIPSAGDGAE